MKDVTSTSFGLVIAFLLPGLSALACLPFWSVDAKTEWQEFAKTPNNVGLFLLVLLAGLTCGLQITLLRWLVFEKILCRKHGLEGDQFQALKDENKFAAFRAVADEHYRYHQFWGGMAIVLPAFFLGLLKSQVEPSPLFSGLWEILSGSGAQLALTIGHFLWELSFFGLVEILTIVAACSAFRLYVERGSKILA